MLGTLVVWIPELKGGRARDACKILERNSFVLDTWVDWILEGNSFVHITWVDWILKGNSFVHVAWVDWVLEGNSFVHVTYTTTRQESQKENVSFWKPARLLSVINTREIAPNKCSTKRFQCASRSRPKGTELHLNLCPSLKPGTRGHILAPHFR